MAHGKTIRLYLVDGVSTGTLTAEIINWTGSIVVSPRSQLPALAKRGETKRTGVYFLVGPDPDKPPFDLVYVGEADNVLSRLALHEKDESKEFWTRTIIVTSKDENLTKSHGRYLESRLIELVRGAGRSTLTNRTAPSPPPLPEADVADMEYFLSQIQLILPALGFSFLQPKPDLRKATTPGGSAPVFKIESVGVKAEAREIDGEFVVLKGSTVRRQGTEGWVSYRGLRQQLIDDGALVDSENADCFVFSDEVAFASPSAAAAVILGRQANGRTEWKDPASGKSYAQWHELQLKLAGVDEASSS